MLYTVYKVSYALYGVHSRWSVSTESSRAMMGHEYDVVDENTAACHRRLVTPASLGGGALISCITLTV